jgi:hypothetical protein
LCAAEKPEGGGEGGEKKPAKKGKELKVLDPKAAQNLCTYDRSLFSQCYQ